MLEKCILYENENIFLLIDEIINLYLKFSLLILKSNVNA